MAYDVTKYFMLILKTMSSNGEKHIESFHLSTEAYVYHLKGLAIAPCHDC